MKRANDIARAVGRAAVLDEIGPLIGRLGLPAFEARELEAVRHAFRKSTALVLRQAWRGKEEADFAPATIRIGWRAT